MDCEKFDQHVLDALYDELDDVSSAAMKRHMESCAHCRDVFAALRATREVAVLPLVEPSAELEERILDAARVAHRTTPWSRKLLRGLTWAGSHAMRPQFAMAAVFILVIGSSMLLLRARPGSSGMVPVRVVERGSPGAEPAEAAPAAAAQPQPEGSARPSAKAAAQSAPVSDARSALAEARSTRSSSGCRAAVAELGAVGARFPGTGAAVDAMWDEASCYKELGDEEKARELYLALLSTSYRERAQRQLDASGASLLNNSQLAARPSPRKAAAAPAATSAPARAADKPASTPDRSAAE